MQFFLIWWQPRIHGYLDLRERPEYHSPRYRSSLRRSWHRLIEMRQAPKDRCDTHWECAETYLVRRTGSLWIFLVQLAVEVLSRLVGITIRQNSLYSNRREICISSVRPECRVFQIFILRLSSYSNLFWLIISDGKGHSISTNPGSPRELHTGMGSVFKCSATNAAITVPWLTPATNCSALFSNNLLIARPNLILALLTNSDPLISWSGLRLHSITNDRCSSEPMMGMLSRLRSRRSWSGCRFDIPEISVTILAVLRP